MNVADTLVTPRDKSYQIIIASCGYERRSSYICRLGLGGDFAIAITYGVEEQRFQGNWSEFAQRGWKLLATTDALYAIVEEARRLTRGRVLIDISSMPRPVLARLIEIFLRPGTAFEVTFTYAPGTFEDSSSAARRDEVLTAEPVSPFFSGELRPTSLPIGLIIGLGLEQYRALGVMELLEPAKSWIFTTFSGDERYKAAAETVHRRMLRTFSPDSVFEYDLRSVAETFNALESLVFSSGLRYRLILAPSGPKVFALSCLLVGVARGPARPAVWRVGGAGPSRAHDVEETGELVAVRVSID